MNNNQFRYMELTYRKAVLTQLKVKAEEEAKGNILLMLGKTIDKELETKQSGALALLKLWKEEIDIELQGLEKEVLTEEFINNIVKAHGKTNVQ